MENRISLAEVVGGGYNAFWHDRARYIALKGGKASKKSTTTALRWIVNLMRYPGSNLLVIRRVSETHRSSTYQQLKWATQRLGVEQLWKCTLSPLEMEYRPTGQKILFRGMDDAQKLASITVSEGHLCWVWIEEAYEIEKESEFDLLDLSAPRGEIPKNLWKQTVLTFNPWNEHHWLKARFFDPPDTELKHTYTTNYLCNEFLDETDRAIYEQMRIENPRKFDVAGLGNWGISEGLIYERWRVGRPDEYRHKKIDVLTGEESQAWDDPDEWVYCVGLDFGYTNDPTAIICLWVNGSKKMIYVEREHYERHMLNDQIAETLAKMGLRKERVIADSAEMKSIDTIKETGQRIEAAKKEPGSVLAGIDQLQSYEIIIDPMCRNTIAEISSYCWDVAKDGTGKNVPVDRNNHLMDAMRYAMQGSRKIHEIQTESFGGGISASDFSGGWV